MCIILHMYVHVFIIMILCNVSDQKTAANVTTIRARVLKSYEDRLEELNICKYKLFS